MTGVLLILLDRHPARNDFGAHWERARQIAAGRWLAVPDPAGSGNYGRALPDGSFVSFNNTAVNSPFMYFPSVFGGGSLLASSLLTLVCCTAVTCAAIRLAGRFDIVILAVALLPTFFLSLVYPTADAVTDSFSLLWVAYVLRVYQRDDGPDWGHVAVLSVLAAGLGQIKITCVCLALLLALPAMRVYRERRRIEFRLLIPFVLAVSSALTWMGLTRGVPPSAEVTAAEYDHAKSEAVRHVPTLLKSLLRTMITPLDLTGDRYDTGRNIQFFTGSEHTQLPAVIMTSVLFACVLLALYRNGALPKLSLPERACVVVVVLGFYALTCTGLIVSWGGVTLGRYAAGMQSRYFIPVLAPLALLLPGLGVDLSSGPRSRRLIAALVVWTYAGLLVAHTLS